MTVIPLIDRRDEPLTCRCPPPVTRLYRWHGADECARCRRLITQEHTA